MKRKLLISCMTAVAALLTTSCTSDLALLEGGTTVNGVDGEEVEVTFSISTESNHAVTRADGKIPGGGPGQWQATIGKATKVDMLIYAVYERNVSEDADGNKVVTHTLLKQYGQGIDNDELKNSKALTMKGADGNVYAHEGQTICYDPFNQKKGNYNKKEITLRLMRNKEYSIAFWAQSSETTAFNTDDLENVEVIYENAENNDELRDAFCKVETFSVGSSESSRTVVLTRPMAQINLGTTGADYSRVVKTKGKKFTQSKITLTGVAQYMNVVEDRIKVKDEEGNSLLTPVTFDYAYIPAVLNMTENMPTTEDEWIGSSEIVKEINDDGEEVYNKEEFLFVDLNDDGVIKNYIAPEETENKKGDNGYSTEYPTLGTDDDGNLTFNTETFKYLSMCYMLVPAETEEEQEAQTVDEEGGQGNEADGEQKKDLYTSSVLNSVTVTLVETGGDGKPDATKKTEISVSQVPVHRNWRTNILCGLYKGKPGDDDDDPTSIFNIVEVRVSINHFFDGEYNTTDKGDSWTQDEYNQGNEKPKGEIPEKEEPEDEEN